MLKNLLDAMNAFLTKDIVRIDADIKDYGYNLDSVEGEDMKGWSDGAKELRYTIANQVNELCRTK